MITASYTTSNSDMLRKCFHSIDSGISFNERDLFFSIVNGIVGNETNRTDQPTNESVDITILNLALTSLHDEIDSKFISECCGTRNLSQLCLILITRYETKKKLAIVSDIQLAQTIIDEISCSFNDYILPTVAYNIH
ncbi:hypothetical protein [Photobacterium damselae]|uniref:hypothetical protein n=1 Tax=Photobacterium damselae TaxID=38293 RepID=UPI0040682A74